MKNKTKKYIGIILAHLAVCFHCYSQSLSPLTNPTISKITQEISADSIKKTITTLTSFGTRHTLSDTISDTQGIGAARRWIKSEFERYAKASSNLTVEFQSTIVPASQRIPHPANIVNVVATLHPKDTASPSAKRIILVSGHYDSRATNVMDSVSSAPGANDDGSGTALVLELARVLSKHEFEATIVFLCVAGEEQGLLGSTAYAEMAKQHGMNIEAMLNNDIVGNIHGGGGESESSYVRVFSEAFNPLDTGSVFQQRISLGQENDGASRTLARYSKEIGERYVPGFNVFMVYRKDRFLRGGDHTPFHHRGFAAIRFTEAKENFDRQHQDIKEENGRHFGDTPEYMNFPYCANITRVNAAIIASLASAPAPPANVGVLSSGLGYETQLKWNKNPEADIAGYYIRYRQTSTPNWEQSVFTLDTTITLKISKDDYLFGVQSVDKDGNCSLVVLPKPVR